MDREESQWIEQMVATYREKLKEVSLRRKGGQIKTLSEMEDEVSRISDEMNRTALEGLLDLKKTKFPVKK